MYHPPSTIHSTSALEEEVVVGSSMEGTAQGGGGEVAQEESVQDPLGGSEVLRQVHVVDQGGVLGHEVVVERNVQLLALGMGEIGGLANHT